MGKSRLIREFLAALEQRGQLDAATVRRATCSSLGEQPYSVFATFFREAMARGWPVLGSQGDRPSVRGKEPARE